MTQLIALIDGSGYSTSVCDHAAWAAERLGAEVKLIHVLGRRGAGSEPVNLSGSIGLGARTALLEELAEADEQNARLSLERGRLILDDASARLAEDGIEAVSGKLRHGELVEAVQDFEGDAELIIIGKRGEAADFAKLHLGSNLERLVRAAHKPVLVASRAFRPLDKLLVAFDGGESSMKAVSYIAASPLFRGMACELITVGTESADTRARQEAAAETLRAAGYAVTAGFEAGEPDAAIRRRVEADDIDLLVMGAYGHSRIRTLIIGSTTTEMIRSCLIPVMLFR